MERIVLSTQKGGCGKTSISQEIATCLSSLGKKVLLIDYDQQTNASVYSDADFTKPTIYEVLMGDCTVEDAIQKRDTYDIIPGSPALSKADKVFVDNDDKYMLADVLDIISDKYDYVIIDTAPTRNICLTQAYIAADHIILPAECDEGSRMGIMAIEEDITKLTSSRDKACHAEILGYILNKYEKTLMHEIAWDNLTELSESKPNKPFVMKVHKAINFSKVKTLHTTVTELAKSSVPARDIHYITEEIVRRVEG